MLGGPEPRCRNPHVNSLGRMPVWASIDAIRKQWLTWLLIQDAAYSLFNMIGRAESESLVLPIVGTCMLLISVVLIMFGWYIVGAGICTVAWSMFTFAWVLSALSGAAGSYGDLVLIIIAGGWHVLVIHEVGTGLDELRERQQRSSGER